MCMYVWMCVCVYVCMYVCGCMDVWMYVCVCMYVCMYVYVMYVCMYAVCVHVCDGCILCMWYALRMYAQIYAVRCMNACSYTHRSHSPPATRSSSSSPCSVSPYASSYTSSYAYKRVSSCYALRSIGGVDVCNSGTRADQHACCYVVCRIHTPDVV